MSLATPGQNARLTFAGAAGQSVTFALTSVTLGTSTCCGAQLTVFKPDGTRLLGPTFFGTNGKTLSTQLPAAGTYSILVDPQGSAAGSFTLRLDAP